MMKRIGLFVRNLFLLGLLFIIPYAYAMFQGGFVSWFLFYSLLPIFLYLFGLWIYPFGKWEVTRKIAKQSFTAGDQVNITLELKRRIPFPLHYCTIEESLPETLMNTNTAFAGDGHQRQPTTEKKNKFIKKMIFPWFKRRLTLQYELINIPRGQHALQCVVLETSDLFGWIRKRHTFSIPSRLDVYPQKWEIIEERHASAFDGHPGTQQVRPYHQTTSAVGVREYAFGDKASWINWKHTARTSTLMTKEFEHEENTHTYILLDRTLTDPMQAEGFEICLALAYSFSQLLKSEESPSHFIALGEQDHVFPLSVRGQPLKEVEQYFMKAQPSNQTARLEKRSQTLQAIPEKAHILFFLPELTDVATEQIMQMTFTRSNITLFLVKTDESSTEQINRRHMLQKRGVHIQILTEKELRQKRVEVRR